MYMMTVHCTTPCLINHGFLETTRQYFTFFTIEYMPKTSSTAHNSNSTRKKMFYKIILSPRLYSTSVLQEHTFILTMCFYLKPVFTDKAQGDTKVQGNSTHEFSMSSLVPPNFLG